jgi:ATPase subunit of ABC transporter with duplicated ATPase domains
MPDVEVRKDIAADARVRIEMRREFFNAMVEHEAKVPDWREAVLNGQAKATGVDQYLRLIATVVERQEERNRSQIAHLEENVTLLAMVRPDVIVMAHTAMSYTLGKEGEWDNWRLEGPSFVWYFRGFPHEETFDLADGKNLILYGENGSGKSSLYRALVEFFNRDSKVRSFGWHRNVFSSGSDQSALDGHVTLEMTDGTRHEWRCLGRRPITDPNQLKDTRERLTDAASRASLLEYRSLLRTYFGIFNIRKRLFGLPCPVGRREAGRRDHRPHPCHHLEGTGVWSQRRPERLRAPYALWQRATAPRALDPLPRGR